MAKSDVSISELGRHSMGSFAAVAGCWDGNCSSAALKAFPNTFRQWGVACVANLHETFRKIEFLSSNSFLFFSDISGKQLERKAAYREHYFCIVTK